jgi:hypothetical protein
VASYRDGKPFSVITLEGGEDQIHAIYVVTNPEKLARLPEMSEPGADVAPDPNANDDRGARPQ